eukprot:122860_1
MFSCVDSFVDRFIFPAPEATYFEDSFPGELLWIDNESPCLFLQFTRATHIIIYFHGNAIDLGGCFHIVDQMRRQFECSIIVPEYPGYGLSPGSASERSVNACAQRVWQFVRSVLRWPAEQTVIWGRSIGSGAAVELVHSLTKDSDISTSVPQLALPSWSQPGPSSANQPALLVLVSAYTSIKSVARVLAGRIPALCVRDRFVNIQKIGEIQCPVYFIHGAYDTLIPASNTMELAALCPRTLHTEIVPLADHNSLSVFPDFTLPLKNMFDFRGGAPVVVPIPDNYFWPPRLSTPLKSPNCMSLFCASRSADQVTDSGRDQDMNSGRDPQDVDSRRGPAVDTVRDAVSDVKSNQETEPDNNSTRPKLTSTSITDQTKTSPTSIPGDLPNIENNVEFKSK